MGDQKRSHVRLNRLYEEGTEKLRKMNVDAVKLRDQEQGFMNKSYSSPRLLTRPSIKTVTVMKTADEEARLRRYTRSMSPSKFSRDRFTVKQKFDRTGEVNPVDPMLNNAHSVSIDLHHGGVVHSVIKEQPSDQDSDSKSQEVAVVDCDQEEIVPIGPGPGRSYKAIQEHLRSF